MCRIGTPERHDGALGFLPWDKGPTSERYGTTIVHPEVPPDSKPSSKRVPTPS